MAAINRVLRPPAVRGRIIFHADDLGMSTAVNEGILGAFERGILTSTSVLANGPAASQGLMAMKEWMPCAAGGELANASRRRALGEPSAAFDLGVHLNLTQGRPLTAHRYPSELLDAQGCFLAPGRLLAALVYHGDRFTADIYAELAEQIRFVRDHGVTPTHANGHQYVEMFPHVGRAVIDALTDVHIPVMRLALENRLAATTLYRGRFSAWALAHIKRRFAARLLPLVEASDLQHSDEFFGTAHAGHITLDVLRRRFQYFADGRLLEVGIHPGSDERADAPTSPWHDPLSALRPRERDLLCCDELVELMLERRLGLGRLSALAAERAAA
ncbi:MAG TPA: ChbG/HpnK family deacetylase [Pirellulales bacterium]|jgi:predicted glycoside hydrolase/deacetylase ChbG (UPF0249 family)|nr:ChbG/HpnK family deacetylase [Pirellulales bacterium]